MWNDEKIPNMASKFKSHNIWTPFWQKNSKLSKYRDGQFSKKKKYKKGVKCYAISILKPDLESSHHFTYFRLLIVITFTFVFLTYHGIFKILQITRAVIFFEIDFFSDQIRNERPKRHNNGWWRVRFDGKNGDHNLA